MTYNVFGGTLNLAQSINAYRTGYRDKHSTATVNIFAEQHFAPSRTERPLLGEQQFIT